jgi:hypothetical protein
MSTTGNPVTLPWDFIGPPKEGEVGVPNLPTPEGAELGRNHVRFYDQEEVTGSRSGCALGTKSWCAHERE